MHIAASKLLSAFPNFWCMCNSNLSRQQDIVKLLVNKSLIGEFETWGTMYIKAPGTVPLFCILKHGVPYNCFVY